MQGLLERRLLTITGKGGVGKTTMAAALALVANGRGRRTVVVEVGEQARIPALLGRRAGVPGEPARLRDGLDSISIDPDRALLEWLQALGGRVSGRVLASSGTFQYFTAAAPGAKELVSMVKLSELTRERRGRGRPGYDLVIFDAPSTGHALGMLRSPQTFGAIARVGPIVRQTDQVSALLSDPERSAYVAVAMGTEMAVTEAIELDAGLRETVGHGLAGVLANGLLPRRFSAGELREIDALAAEPAPPPGLRANRAEPRVGAAPRVRAEPGSGRVAPEQAVAAAVRAARAVHDRAGIEHGQVARLRRRGFDVVSVPFQWVPELNVAAIEAIAGHLEGKL